MSAKIICAWCLVVIRADVPELEKDSHGICERCKSEEFSDVSDTETIDEEPEPYELEVDPADVGRDDRAWNQEIAREEGMLGGIESFNDWGGSYDA